MPLETIEAFQDHGKVRGDTVTEDLDAAKKLLKDLAKAGVDYADVIDTLEAEGVEKFSVAFHELLDGIRSKRDVLAAA
jgi:transaldolase